MPDLGKYADTVILAYAASLILLGGLVVLSIWQSKKTRTALRQAEEAAKNGK